MSRYRITKLRTGWYNAEKKALIGWRSLALKATLEDAIEIVREEQDKDKEGLPRVVWECDK